jgi:hypothetical protein
MNLRTRYMPGVYTVTDEDTGEILVFALWGTLQHVRLFDLSVRHTQRRSPRDDYAPSAPE